MKTARENNNWIMNILLALIEFPIIIFLSYFSLGSREDVVEIYYSNPFRIIFIRGCVSFIATSFVMFLIIVLSATFKRVLLNIKTTQRELFSSLKFNSAIISIEIVGVLIYKLITRGYI